MKGYAVVVMLFLLLPTPVSGDVDARCPESIEVDERLARPAAGWAEGRATEPHRLAGMRFFDGKLEDRASLVGKDRALSRVRSVTTWHFATGREYWVSCSYAWTSIILSGRLSSEIKSCSVTYASDALVNGLPEIKKVECR